MSSIDWAALARGARKLAAQNREDAALLDRIAALLDSAETMTLHARDFEPHDDSASDGLEEPGA